MGFQCTKENSFPAIAEGIGRIRIGRKDQHGERKFRSAKWYNLKKCDVHRIALTMKCIHEKVVDAVFALTQFHFVNINGVGESRNCSFKA